MIKLLASIIIVINIIFSVVHSDECVESFCQETTTSSATDHPVCENCLNCTHSDIKRLVVKVNKTSKAYQAIIPHGSTLDWPWPWEASIDRPPIS